MRRPGVLLVSAAAAAVVLAAAAALVPLAARLPWVRAQAAASLVQAVGRPVRFGTLALRLWPAPALEAHGLEIADDPRFGPEPFALVERAALRLRLRPLLLGGVEVDSVVLTRPRLRLVEGDGRRWNVASLGSVREASAAGRAAAGGREARPAPLAGPAAAPRRVVVEGGSIAFVPLAELGLRRVEDVRLVVTASERSIEVEGGGIVGPGGIAVALHGVRVTPGRGGADARLEGGISLRGGPAAGPLSALPAGLTLSGRLTASLVLGGTLAAPTLTGEVRLERASLARDGTGCHPPGPRTLALEAVTLALAWTEGAISGRPLQASHGGGTVAATVHAVTGRGGRITLDGLRVSGLPLGPVLGDFLCDGYAVTGPLELAGRLVFDARDPARTLSGDGRLAIRNGTVVGPRAVALFGDVARAGGVAAPFEFDSITATYRIEEGVVSTHDLRYAGTELRVWADGRYALATGDLDVAMRVQHAGGRVRARLSGTAQAPALRVETAAAARGDQSRPVVDTLRRHFR